MNIFNRVAAAIAAVACLSVGGAIAQSQAPLVVGSTLSRR
jgi:hypothetical protein